MTSIIRKTTENSANFTYKLSPAIKLLEKIDWSTSDVVFAIPSNYTIKSINYLNGLLSIVVDFISDLENLNSTLKISFDSNYVIALPIKLNFTAVGNNIPLLIYKNMSQAAQMKSAS